ncbi:hypothetical protein T190115A13A_50084 [Tenacibaculum sp. 190524A02b]|uniref:Uncharacterized protein n=1 Tax=Tenacibaculum vairaonense TaxID=3137860 RepID=A0ABP1FBU8_9FLAO
MVFLPIKSYCFKNTVAFLFAINWQWLTLHKKYLFTFGSKKLKCFLKKIISILY